MDITKNEHLKIAIYLGFFLGAWPMAYRNNPYKRHLYKVYFILTLLYTILYVIASYYDLYTLVISKDILNMPKILQNMCVTLPLTITPLRALVMMRPKIINLIQKILDSEDVILSSNDEKVVEIYKSHVKKNRVANVFFFINTTLLGVYFLNQTDGKLIKFDPFTNTSTILKPLPLSTWFPFDTQKHYALGYIVCIIDVTIGGSYFAFIDLLMLGMIIFPVGQIKILIHVLSNFPKYVLKVKDQLQCSRDEASLVTMRECLIMHNDIIKYINTYNASMSTIALFDFMQSSLQLASIVLQLIMGAKNLMTVVTFGQFIFYMLTRLLFSYWFANEILTQSSNLSTAVFESEWYNEPEKVKQLMRMMILRTNRPLGLKIGFIATMTLETFVKIIKTTYSYLMLMYK